MVRTILLIGLGNVGFHILQLLARTPGISRIVASARNEPKGLAKVENATIAAAIQGFYPEISFTKSDLWDIEKTSEMLKEVDPDVICNAAMWDNTFWIKNQLPLDVRNRFLEAGNGPFISIPMTLTYRLMRALRKSGVNSPVVSCAYGDAVNAVLGKVGLSPTVGAGNIDLWSQQVRKYASEKLEVRLRDVSVFMVAHHGVISSRGQAPFWYKILLVDKNVTNQFPLEEIRPLMRYTTLWPEPGEHIASSFARSITDIYFDTGELRHAPGPIGLQGGYPVRLSAKGVEVVLPEELNLKTAVEINEKAARFDGIERIESDGTVVFTEKSAEIMKETLGCDHRELKLGECEERAKELVDLFNRMAEKYNICMPSLEP
jgi:hypothetical protein